MDETQMQSGLVVVMVTAVPLMYLNKKKKRKPRWHERPHLGPIQRSTRGQQATLHIMRIHDPQSFFRTLPFYPEDFDKLLHMVGPYITKANIRRESVNPSTRLALTLRYLATGEKQSSIALSYLIGETTAREIIWETTWVIWKVLEPLVMPQPNEQLFEDVADGFWKRWDVPNCCGSLDGKLIRIKVCDRTH